MPLVVETGVGLVDSDAFCSLEYANAYNAGHLDSDTWSMEGTGSKEKAIRLATRRISDGWVWFGRRRTPGQSLEWPRIGVLDAAGWPVSSSAVPEAVRRATAELARRIIADHNAGSLTDDSSTGAVKSVNVGPIGIVFDTTVGAKALPEVPDDVSAMLRPFGYPTRGTGRMGRLVR